MWLGDFDLRKSGSPRPPEMRGYSARLGELLKFVAQIFKTVSSIETLYALPVVPYMSMEIPPRYGGEFLGLPMMMPSSLDILPANMIQIYRSFITSRGNPDAMRHTLNTFTKGLVDNDLLISKPMGLGPTLIDLALMVADGTRYNLVIDGEDFYTEFMYRHRSIKMGKVDGYINKPYWLDKGTIEPLKVDHTVEQILAYLAEPRGTVIYPVVNLFDRLLQWNYLYNITHDSFSFIDYVVRLARYADSPKLEAKFQAWLYNEDSVPVYTGDDLDMAQHMFSPQWKEMLLNIWNNRELDNKTVTYASAEIYGLLVPLFMDDRDFYRLFKYTGSIDGKTTTAMIDKSMKMFMYEFERLGYLARLRREHEEGSV